MTCVCGIRYERPVAPCAVLDPALDPNEVDIVMLDCPCGERIALPILFPNTEATHA